jgi:hypothetical protein
MVLIILHLLLCFFVELWDIRFKFVDDGDEFRLDLGFRKVEIYGEYFRFFSEILDKVCEQSLRALFIDQGGEFGEFTSLDSE